MSADDEMIIRIDTHPGVGGGRGEFAGIQINVYGLVSVRKHVHEAKEERKRRNE
ncbi:Uncharacterized protein APZ42_021921 [Daphnia magna]|uniref:Uncharacterized protein n=1 Tax=Daphnia magna TaxID=35525 RepID=A0A162C996_9CRUS|nr:Uncharacterized protein APZ42_021921 [Daphnia magna]